MSRITLKLLFGLGLALNLASAQAFDLGQELRNAASELQKPGKSLGGYSEEEEGAIGGRSRAICSVPHRW